MKRVPWGELEYPEGNGPCYHGGERFTGTGFTLHPDGTLASESQMRDGVAWGTARRWTRIGVLVLDRRLENDVLHGRAREWYPSGAPAADEVGETGVCTARRRWAEGGGLVGDWVMARDGPAYREISRCYRRYGFSTLPDPADPPAAPDPAARVVPRCPPGIPVRHPRHPATRRSRALLGDLLQGLFLVVLALGHQFHIIQFYDSKCVIH